MFHQDMFYYKFDLKIPNLLWTGTKGCRKKYLSSPQWLRNVKDRKYFHFRIDILFSEKKYVKKYQKAPKKKKKQPRREARLKKLRTDLKTGVFLDKDIGVVLFL